MNGSSPSTLVQFVFPLAYCIDSYLDVDDGVGRLHWRTFNSVGAQSLPAYLLSDHISSFCPECVFYLQAVWDCHYADNYAQSKHVQEENGVATQNNGDREIYCC